MAMAGHVESGNAASNGLPFMLGQKRPNKTRFEMLMDRQRSVRVFDGSSGWKMRTDGASKTDVQPYSDDELRFARGAAVIEGPLMDYAAHGAGFSVEGSESIDGRLAYVLGVKLPSGGQQRVWVDAETFLELRHDREMRGGSAQPVVLSLYFRDYRKFEDLWMPTTIETRSATGAVTSKLLVERVALNPNMDDRLFAKPSVGAARHHGAVVDTREASPSSGATMGSASRP